MIKFHQKYFIESIPYVTVHADKIRQNKICYNNIDGIENKLTCFQTFPETKLACKYKTSLYKTQLSEILVEYEKSFDVIIEKINNKPKNNVKQ